jgi:hypothetical protein
MEKAHHFISIFFYGLITKRRRISDWRQNEHAKGKKTAQSAKDNRNRNSVESEQ